MRILFINSHSADYVQDLTYSGLVKIFGLKNVIDYRWNQKYHVPYKKYPKNLGYVAGSFLPSLTHRSLKRFDIVFVGSAKIDCFETYLAFMDRIPMDVPVVFIDGGDWPEIGRDLTAYNRPDLYNDAIAKRPFDLVFKREMLIDQDYGENVFPLPMSFNIARAKNIPKEKKYQVSFWAVESHPTRVHALDLLTDKFDCKVNGTERNQKFSKYKRKGEFYLQELARCKIVLNFRGGGWDTMRYWEVPAVGSFMISQRPQFVIPHNFEHEKHVVFCQDDLSDLIDLCEYYLKNDTAREQIASNGKNHLLQYHTDVKRAEYVIQTIRNICKNL
ncbi:glycosyltransferase family protein [Kaarinaea lacus]